MKRMLVCIKSGGKIKGLLTAQPREGHARLPHVPRAACESSDAQSMLAFPGSWHKQPRQQRCPLLHKGLRTVRELSPEAHFKISQVPADASCPVLQASFKMFYYFNHREFS